MGQAPTVKDINDGISEHEETKNMSEEEVYYEKMSEAELLQEYSKLSESIKNERQLFKDNMAFEKERGNDTGRSFTGDNKSDVYGIKILTKLMDEKGIPYDKLD